MSILFARNVVSNESSSLSYTNPGACRVPRARAHMPAPPGIGSVSTRTFSLFILLRTSEVGQALFLCPDYASLGKSMKFSLQGIHLQPDWGLFDGIQVLNGLNTRKRY